GAFKVGKADLGLRTTNYRRVQEEEELQRKAEDTRLLYVAATRARDCLLLPHFQFPAGSKTQKDKLFAGPLLKALEAKGTHGGETKDKGEPLGDPPAWVVPLEEKAGSPALAAEKEKLRREQEDRKEKLENLRGLKEFRSVTSVVKTEGEKLKR